MTNTDDPFERVIARESRLRKRAESLSTRDGAMRMVIAIFGGMAVLWAALLAGHWALLAEPRWLVVLHTMVFTLTVGYGAASALFATWMLKRHPGVRGEL